MENNKTIGAFDSYVQDGLEVRALRSNVDELLQALKEMVRLYEGYGFGIENAKTIIARTESK